MTVLRQQQNIVNIGAFYSSILVKETPVFSRFFLSSVFIPTVYINTYLRAQCVFLVSLKIILYAIYSRTKRGIVFENRIMNNEVTSIVSLLPKWPS